MNTTLRVVMKLIAPCTDMEVDQTGRRLRARASDLRDHGYHLVENARISHLNLVRVSH